MLNCFQQNELKGERGDSGVKGEKGEPGGGYYDPRFGGVQGQPGPPGKPGLPVSSESKVVYCLKISGFTCKHMTCYYTLTIDILKM